MTEPKTTPTNVTARSQSVQDAIREIQAHYAQTGAVPAAEMLTVLGDPTRGMEVKANPSVAACAWKVV